MSFGTIDNNIQNSLDAARKFKNDVRDSLFSIFKIIEVGGFDKSFTQSGLQSSLGKSTTAGASFNFINDISDPFARLSSRNYQIGSMTPNANVLIKKRLFTTLAHDNDIRFMDAFERSFLRTSKNLFQLKAFQIATYESLTKFEQVLKQDKTLHIPALLTAVQGANAFGIINNTEAASMQSILFQIAQRDDAGTDTNFTTWYINHFDLDLAHIGRGVGVLELTNFTKLDTSNRIHGDGGASIDFEDPYHIMLISSDDIEATLRNSLFDSFTSTLLPAIATEGLRPLADTLQEQINNINPVIQAQAAAAINTVKQTAFDILSQPLTTPELIKFVRMKMRKFYLGKSVIQPTDGIHIFIKSDTIHENDNDAVGLPLGLDKFGIDEEILKQEMYAVTKDRNFDINLYRILRNKNAFSGASVFAGVVEKVSDNFTDGFYTLSVTAKNNLWFLEQAQVNTQPALDQSQGFLHDPLTPFDFKFDSFGNLKTIDNNGNVGLQLSQDNIDRLNRLRIVYENGTRRGVGASVDNIVSGSVPGTNIQYAEHFPGMLYKWKEGIASISVAMNTSDPTGLFYNRSRELANSTYGLAITSTPFDNMDAANVVSLLVTGLPYNISNFINDSFITGAVNSLAEKGSSDISSYFGSFFDIIQRQNRTLGNFKPLLNGDSVNIDTIKKLAIKKISFRQLDTKIGELENQIFEAQQRLDRLPLNALGGETDLLIKTRQGLEAEIAALRQEQDVLIQQFVQIDNEISRISSNQDSLGFSLDPEERELQMKDYQFRQLYAASRRIEDVRYNRDINYFIVGTEYDSDLDIQAFQTNLRNGFKYFENTYDPAINKVREAARAIDFEIFADNSGNIRFRPPQYNKVPLSIYYELFRRGQTGADVLPDFIKDLFVSNISLVRENIVRLNWEMLIELGKGGNDTLINAFNAYVEGKTQNILEFLGYKRNNNQIVIADGNVINELIEFNSADQVNVDRRVPPSSQTTNNMLDIEVLQTIGRQLEKRFGNSRIVITQEDIVADNDNAAISKRKDLFAKLRRISSQRNTLIRSYLSQLNNLGINANDMGSSQPETQSAVNNAVLAKQSKLMQEVFQIVATGNIQGYARPTISPEFQNLIEDDSRNFIGRGSGRRFIIRDDIIKSFRIEESQPDYCRINVVGQVNFGDQAFGPSVLEGRALWAGAVDYDLWRMYGFKQDADIKTPFLSDPETQLKPYSVFLLLKQRGKVMKGTITIIGNEYYQLGDVVYLADRDMLFYVTSISHSFSQGEDFSTTLSLEYGRPPGEYIPTPLDVIGKTLLKQSASTLSLTKRQITPDTFYYPLRPTPVLYLEGINTNDDSNMEKMLRTDSNQGRLINALMNANIALQKPNTVLVISGFNTSSNSGNIQSRLDLVKTWFSAPKVLGTNLQGQGMSEFKDYNAIPGNKIITKIINMTSSNNNQKQDPSPDDVIASDQTIIESIGDSNLELGIKNACQECYALIDDINNVEQKLPLIVEIGIFYKKPE